MCLAKTGRLLGVGNTLTYKRYLQDFPIAYFNNIWTDTIESTFAVQKVYVVQTGVKVIERCILMATDPGDLVLDPTCGSGTTAYVSEQWGRRWITIDTSRVALALARARVMGARYPYYLLADSREGQIKEAQISRKEPSNAPIRGDIRQGFVYERVPHVTLKSIANNTEIDVIWEKWQEKLEPIRQQLNSFIGQKWEEWEIPRKFSDVIPAKAGNQKASKEVETLHAQWWQHRIERQKEIDASIAAKAEVEYLYDKPYNDKKKVRVAGPFTVESLLPHRVLTVDENDELIDGIADSASSDYGTVRDFTQIILENLKIAGVQQAH
jgi:adenine-specific DNA-methyltransferase